jgi:hypothetical protein
MPPPPQPNEERADGVCSGAVGAPASFEKTAPTGHFREDCPHGSDDEDTLETKRPAFEKQTGADKESLPVGICPEILLKIR